MIDLDVLDKNCSKCNGLGKTVNPSEYPLWSSRGDLKVSFHILKPNEKSDEPIFNVCKECNGTGKILPVEVKELLEYILS